MERCRITRNNSYGVNSWDGGAIHVDIGSPGIVTLNACEISGNSTHVNGDGIYFGIGVSATLSNCVVSGNSCAGGAIGNHAQSLTLLDCSITNNNGGSGIYTEGSITAQRCTVANNRISGNGAGFYLTSYGTNTFVNCTIYGNVSSNGTGGGIYINSGLTTIYNSTVAGNAASNGGGGIYNLYGTCMAYSTIVAGNTASFCPDISGLSSAADHCLIGNNTNGGNTYVTMPPAGQPNAYGSYVGTGTTPLDPLLQPPADNGGATPTCALQRGSPAVDHGRNPLGLATDQRFLVKYPRQYGLATDIGAYEYQPPGGTLMLFR